MNFVQGIGSERSESSLVLTLNNPGRRNAFYPEMRRELVARIREAGIDASIRAIIITGADGHFCTGADLSRVSAREHPPTAMETRENMKEVMELLRAIRAGPKPVIAAVEGDAYGAGCSIALASDVLVAARGARFGMTFPKIGLVPDLGMIYTLSERVGRHVARRIMLAGSVFEAEPAHAIGMVDEITEKGGAVEKALETAMEFATSAPIPVALIKGAMSSRMTSLEEIVQIELDIVPLATSSDDAREGIRSFMEKRQPAFVGK